MNTLSDHVLINLRKISRAIDVYSTQLVKKYGLTGPQLILLKTCLQESKLTTTQVANRINISKATVTSITDRLCQKGYISREKCYIDKRKVFLVPTAKTIELFNEASPQLLQESFISQFNNLKDWEQMSIVANLQRVAYMLNAQNIEASPVLESSPMCHSTNDE